MPKHYLSFFKYLGEIRTTVTECLCSSVETLCALSSHTTDMQELCVVGPLYSGHIRTPAKMTLQKDFHTSFKIQSRNSVSPVNSYRDHNEISKFDYTWTS